MKLICLFLVLALSSALAYPQQQQLKDPKIYIEGGGNRRNGFDVNANIRKNVWESNNGKHSFDVTGGYSQHLGGPWGNSEPNRRVGGVYTYRW